MDHDSCHKGAVRTTCTVYFHGTRKLLVTVLWRHKLLVTTLSNPIWIMTQAIKRQYVQHVRYISMEPGNYWWQRFDVINYWWQHYRIPYGSWLRSRYWNSKWCTVQFNITRKLLVTLLWRQKITGDNTIESLMDHDSSQKKAGNDSQLNNELLALLQIHTF